MKVIGITGGIGSGKTEILRYIEDNCRCKILHGDDIAKRLQEPGKECYSKIVSLLGREILTDDGSIDRGKMAAAIFRDGNSLKKVNGIIHPAVERYILNEINTERENGQTDYLFIEAALLIECGYEKICDELWYIYADENVRRTRLKTDRGYPDEKITEIMNSQQCESVFRKVCTVTIDNSGTLENTCRQIDKIIGGNET